MAKAITSGMLKATIAEALRLPEKRVDYPYRAAQERGVISRGKRGKGGATQTPRDAATTLLALASSFIGDEVVRALQEQSQAPIAFSYHRAQEIRSPGGSSSEWALLAEEELDGGPWVLDGYSIPHLQTLPPHHTFLDALTAVIEAARDNAFTEAMQKKHTDSSALFHEIYISVSGPKMVADIELNFRTETFTYFEEAAYFQMPSIKENKSEDACFSVEFKLGYPEIYKIAQLFRTQDENTTLPSGGSNASE